MVEGMRKGEATQGVRGQQGKSPSSPYIYVSEILSILTEACSVLASLR